jgi:hypothetical protein
MPNWPQKSSPHVWALSQAVLHESMTPVADDEATPVDATEDDPGPAPPTPTDEDATTLPGPVPTDTDAIMFAPVELGLLVVPTTPVLTTLELATMAKPPPAPPPPPVPSGFSPSTITLPPQAPMKPAAAMAAKVARDMRE